MSIFTPDKLYGPKEPTDPLFRESVGLPGQYPYTRGIYPGMYVDKRWTIRQYAGFGTARETNRRLRHLLEQGVTGLSLAFDLPTQLGLDSDDPLARGEVGKTGVAVSSLWDLDAILYEIPLDRVSTSMTINAPAAVLTAMMIAVAERRGIAPETLCGTVQNDILKEYAARGTYIYPPEPSMRLVTDLIEYSARHMPKWNAVSISGYHIREAGATAAQELAFAFANGIAYVESAVKRGLSIDELAPRLSFFFAAHTRVLEEAAKFRAARRVWARIMRERFGARNPKSCMLRFHTQTGGVTLTAQLPDNNAARVTLQALAAVLGGTQSLHTNAKDEAFGLPTEETSVSALHIQHVLACESGAGDTVDPLAGSFFVEAMTDRIESEVWVILGKIDALGGAVQAASSGYYRREIHLAAYRDQLDLEAGRRVVVGVNAFEADPDSKGLKLKLLRTSDTLAKRHAEQLKRLRSKRDAFKVRQSLDRLRQAAQSGENLLPPLIEAVKAEATIGEMCGTLRDVFGVFSEPEEGI